MMPLLNVLLSIFISFLHPFHVSINEISYNGKEKSIEITKKIFTDNLELALKNSGYTLYINKNNDINIKNAIHEYLKDKFHVSINGTRQQMEFIGYEIEEDAVWCYFQIQKIKAIKNATIFDATLLETYSDQVNLVHFTHNLKVESFKLDQASKEKSIFFD